MSLISDKRSLTLMTCSITDFSTSSSSVIANFNISVGPLTGHPYNSSNGENHVSSCGGLLHGKVRFE
jgi:hypothetical protein